MAISFQSDFFILFFLIFCYAFAYSQIHIHAPKHNALEQNVKPITSFMRKLNIYMIIKFVCERQTQVLIKFHWNGIVSGIYCFLLQSSFGIFQTRMRI